jgi:hypothetical protein
VSIPAVRLTNELPILDPVTNAVTNFNAPARDPARPSSRE